MQLTDLQVRKITPKNARFELADGKGLYLRIMPTGAKSWIFRYRYDGKPRRLTLGAYPVLSLSDAREKHFQAMQVLINGIDPGVKRKEEKAKRKSEPTIKELFDEYWEVELKHKTTANEQKRMIVKDGLPAWGTRKVKSITRRDAVLLLDKVRERAPVGANRLQTVLVRMMNFAAERGLLEHSPLTGMRRAKEKTRARVLTDAEIKRLWECLDLENKDFDMYRLVKLALKAILLSGQRPGEVLNMTWAQIDDETAIWTSPAELRKTREENRIPICPMFKALLEQAKVYSGDSEHVFRSSHKDKTPLTVKALNKTILRHRQEMEIAHFTPHDLRRTLRTRLAEIGISDVVAERILGHKLQGVLGIYNRHSYDIEKRQALILWEQRLSEILGLTPKAASNVVAFRPRAASNGIC